MWKGRFTELRAEFDAFFAAEVVPAEPRWLAERAALKEAHPAPLAPGRWVTLPVVDELTAKAKARGLWNLFLPHASGLTQHEYAQLAETMGGYPWATQCFNCDAPDTGNMETLHLFGTAAQQQQWLAPLLAGAIRSAIAMTEPAVASSDATNIETFAEKDGGDYVINGRKHYITAVRNERCKLLIAFVRTRHDGPAHKRHSMILVPRDAPGVAMVRPMEVFGDDDCPAGHWEMTFTNVRVPQANILKGEGEGFAIAQGRLGPGRVHHAMRSIGMAERGLGLMVGRAVSRKAFGKRLAQLGMVQKQIADSRAEVAQARLLVLDCAAKLDTVGARGALQEIAMIKVVAPNVACRVLDRAMQVHGALGLSQDTVLPMLYAGQRSLRLADGPDEVHMVTIARLEVKRYMAKL
jgi:acyl-CoA dehydrogenase